MIKNGKQTCTQKSSKNVSKVLRTKGPSTLDALGMTSKLKYLRSIGLGDFELERLLLRLQVISGYFKVIIYL